ncbi:MAG: DUF4390 domain-containing protein [Comamonas sp.]|nr:DUF4390 domain-containing protein [Comamonas sp.]
MMDSSTPCSKKPPEPALLPAPAPALAPAFAPLAACPRYSRRAWLLGAAVAVGAAALAASAPPAWAQDSSITLVLPDGILLERSGQDLFLSAQWQWQLPAPVEQALLHGIPIHFVIQAELRSKRWYWRDEVLLHSRRHLRLSYQALTRRWRLHSGSQAFDGLGLNASPGHSYHSLDEALAALQRLVRWRIGSASELPSSGQAWLQLRFGIDSGQLPRALQLGTVGTLGRSDWGRLGQFEHPIDLERVHDSLAGAQMRPRALCGVANPRDSSGYHCGLRLAAHPDPHPAHLRDEIVNTFEQLL